MKKLGGGKYSGSPLFAGVGRANNADNVGNANYVYGPAANVKNTFVTHLGESQKMTEDVVQTASGKDRGMWDDITSDVNIYSAVCKVLGYDNPELKQNDMTRGKQIWWRNRDANISRIKEMMAEDTFDFGEYKTMEISMPKKRVIHCHKSLNVNVAETAVVEMVTPLYEAVYSRHSYSSIKGRGTIAAMKHLRKSVVKNPEGYYVQVDVRKYFANIDGEILKRDVSEVIEDARTREFIWQLIDSFSPGIPIGIPFSHLNANLYLTSVDRMLEAHEEVIDFVRNMDDIVCVCADKEGAKRVMASLREAMAERGLEIKPNAKLAPLKCGIDTLGYVIYPTHTRIRKSIKERLKRKIRRMEKCGAPEDAIRRMLSAYYGWLKHGNCRHLLQKAFGSHLAKFNKYPKDMRIPSIEEIKPRKKFFGLDKDRFISVTSLTDKTVAIFDVKDVTIKGEAKIAIKFCFMADLGDDPSEQEIEAHACYTITRSGVLMDKLSQDFNGKPFACTIRQVKNYYTYD